MLTAASRSTCSNVRVESWNRQLLAARLSWRPAGAYCKVEMETHAHNQSVKRKVCMLTEMCMLHHSCAALAPCLLLLLPG
jgi:hypothetical protein